MNDLSALLGKLTEIAGKLDGSGLDEAALAALRRLLKDVAQVADRAVSCVLELLRWCAAVWEAEFTDAHLTRTDRALGMLQSEAWWKEQGVCRPLRRPRERFQNAQSPLKAIVDGLPWRELWDPVLEFVRHGEANLARLVAAQLHSLSEQVRQARQANADRKEVAREFKTVAQTVDRQLRSAAENLREQIAEVHGGSDAEQLAQSVAVVAVHGVGDQIRNQTAEVVAKLLLAQNRGATDASGAQYTPFQENRLQIGVRPAFSDDIVAPEDPSARLTRQLLQGYDGKQEESTGYDTVRLEGARLDDHDPPRRRTRIHVYEMYWADLSRFGSGVISFFGELFQLLFHLGNLGRQTAQFAEENPRVAHKRHWWLIRWIQILAVWVLAVPLAVLNLYEVALALLMLPASLGGEAARIVAVGGLIGLVAVGIGFLLFRFHPAALPRLRVGIWAVGLLLGVGAGLFLGPKIDCYRLLAFEWAAIACGLLYTLLRTYTTFRNNRRPSPV
jgi:hypothetical protein